jgi:hypothetical protein
MSDNSLFVVTLKAGACSDLEGQFLRTLAPLPFKCKPRFSSCNTPPLCHVGNMPIYRWRKETGKFEVDVGSPVDVQ